MMDSSSQATFSRQYSMRCGGEGLRNVSELYNESSGDESEVAVVTFEDDSRAGEEATANAKDSSLQASSLSSLQYSIDTSTAPSQ